MVFQSYALWPHMDVYNNISFPLKRGVRRVPASDAARRIESVAEILELTPYLRRSISQLSGGQQQRVALARALALEPSVLLMDEPLSNLDAKLRTQLRIEIKALSTKLGITTIYVTHDQVEAMVIGDRIAVMNNGAIAAEGTADSLYKSPKTEFVAKFLGEMNFIAGNMQPQVNGIALVDTIIGQIRVLDVPADMVPGAARIGFRPEDIVPGKIESANVFSAHITNRYYVGDAVLCDMTIANESISARLPNDVESQPGQEDVFSIKASAISVFPGGT